MSIETYEINGAVQSPSQAEQALRDCAAALGGRGQAGALLLVREQLKALRLDGETIDLYDAVIQQLIGLEQRGGVHADEFNRQVALMITLIASDPDIAETQAGGWLDPRLR